MIIINFNKPEFEYDVHSLIKAFFPKEDVEMYYTCAESEVEGKNVACTHRELGSIDLKEAEQVFFIDYSDSKNPDEFPKDSYDSISIRWEIKSSYTNKEKVDVQEIAQEENLSKNCGEHTLIKESFSTEFTVDSTNRKETKNALKQQLYDLLKKGSKRELPWGTLTGIRPTKIPMKLMEEGYSEEEIASYMKETYFATDEKIQLSIDIAKREKALLSKIDYENGYSLYIGIPFCPSTCLYCSFTSYPLAVWSKQVDAYLDALEKEIDFTSAEFQHKKLNSIYIGGGTPTTLNPQQLDRLIHKVKSSFDLQHCVEFTVEAGRPDSITREKLAVLRKHGIDRISINPQTMKQETLDLIGRRHTVEEIVESFKQEDTTQRSLEIIRKKLNLQ